MKKTLVFKMLITFCMIALFTAFNVTNAQANESKWKFGIGTGLFGLNLDGTIGMDIPLLGGAQKIDIDMDSSDVRDVMDTAFGFGGYATNGTWLIDYSLVYLRLEDRGSDSSHGIDSAKFKYEASGFELLAGYPVLRNANIILYLHGGVRYTRHESRVNVTISGTHYTSKIDEDWVDGVIGVSANIPVAETVMWNNRITAAYGGSDGTYSVNSGLAWRFHKNWSTSLYGKFTAVEFENRSKGSSDWYLYDVNEFGAGVNILFHW
jgi:hypothetical protein